MRRYPNLNDEYDIANLERLKALPWQLDCLKKNPSYVGWGNNEDYMSEDNKGWRSRVFLDSWDEKFDLDEYNELVNFYFFIERASHECPHCNGSGYNSATKYIFDAWYDFEGTGKRWCYHINDNEVKELVKQGRLQDLTKLTPTIDYPEILTSRYFFDEKINAWSGWASVNGVNQSVLVNEPLEYPSAVEVNAWASKGFGHDAINRLICCETRAKSLGVYGYCDYCQNGIIYDADVATLKLQLWYLHPRKGASKGVLIEKILENEIPEVVSYLKEAAERNSKRFSNL